jgi:peptidoglycan hydrolase CwlO-like protein
VQFDDKDQFPESFQPDARSHIHNEIHALSKEAQEVVEAREEARQKIMECDTRLTQIAGAISSLNKLLEKIK